MTFSTLRTETEDGVFTITLNRPDKLNALNAPMVRDFVAAIDEADSDDAVRAIVVTGEGRGFCAGADLSGGANTFSSGDGSAADSTPRDAGGLITLRHYDCKKFLVAAINGPEVGVGATMTLPMDVRLASTRARMGFVFTRRGIVPEACSSWFLPRVVGISQAMRWVASGRVFPADEALAGGLVSEVLEPEALLPRALEIAREVVENTSAVSLALSRQMLWKMLGADHPMEAHKVDSRGVHFMGASADAREGVQSFLEKRAPRFELRVSQDMPDYYPWWSERSFED